MTEMPSQIHHAGLTVSDLERSVTFYTTFFGLRVLSRNQLLGRMISAQTDLEGVVIDTALLAGDNALLELLCYRSPEGRSVALRACDPGAAHVCLVVADLDATYEAMRADGVPLHAHPAQLGAGTKMMYVRDPDGIMVEVIQPTDDISLARLLKTTDDEGGPLNFSRG
jgi:catechol 2,3-dioxygenase-like lactoylglutathione lyase family enzyme